VASNSSIASRFPPNSTQPSSSTRKTIEIVFL
jgi:hypothetical protein